MLIEKAQYGDTEAMDQLIQANLDRIYRVCLLYMKNEFDAEDAAQETFVKIWKNIRKFDVYRNFNTWTHEIAKNTCFDLLKKKHVIPLGAMSEQEAQHFENAHSKDLLPFDHAHNSSVRSWLIKASSKLSEPYRQVLSLYYEQQMNFREIALQLGEPIDTVKSRHRRAILQLRKNTLG